MWGNKKKLNKLTSITVVCVDALPIGSTRIAIEALIDTATLVRADQLRSGRASATSVTGVVRVLRHHIQRARAHVTTRRVATNRASRTGIIDAFIYLCKTNQFKRSVTPSQRTKEKTKKNFNIDGKKVCPLDSRKISKIQFFFTNLPLDVSFFLHEKSFYCIFIEFPLQKMGKKEFPAWNTPLLRCHCNERQSTSTLTRPMISLSILKKKNQNFFFEMALERKKVSLHRWNVPTQTEFGGVPV